MSYTANAQIEGCTDPYANNFDPNASINDGSCSYNPTFYKPDVDMILGPGLEETSGLVFWNGGLWSHNDSGGEAVLYKIDTNTAEIIQTVQLSNGSNKDWEDLAQDASYIYIGDIGNNAGNRDDLRIYRIKKSDIPASANVSLAAEFIDLSYEDQTSKPQQWRSNNFDCEAMIVAGDSIYLFSKNWADFRTKLYVIPRHPGEYVAEKRYTYDINGLVTGADYNEAANEIVLCGYQNYVPFMFLLWDFEGLNFFSGNKRRIDFPEIITSQTEGIAYYKGKELYISAEKTPTLSQRIYDLGTGQWTTAPATAVEAVLSPEISFEIQPNPVKGRSFKISISSLPARDFELQLFDSTGRLFYRSDYELEFAGKNIDIKIVARRLETGLYLVQINSGGYYASRKVIIQ
ncbi:MAG: T9SS type A sorting domain-containing protein [Bacteroidota bacterium]|nr:T9SS type A sorting domain-containing protein [Bacteroidota bacterium]